MRTYIIVFATFAFAALAVACEAIVGFSTEEPKVTAEDTDEGGAVEDGASRGGPDDAGVDAAEDAPPPFAACACPKSEGCCLASGGGGACTPPADAGQCISAGKVFLRCAAGDVENGRACCLAADKRSSFTAGDCRDAGARLCLDNGECADEPGAKTCSAATCRGLDIKVCAGATSPGEVCN